MEAGNEWLLDDSWFYAIIFKFQVVLIRFSTGFHPLRWVLFKLRRGIAASATSAPGPPQKSYLWPDIFLDFLAQRLMGQVPTYFLNILKWWYTMAKKVNKIYRFPIKSKQCKGSWPGIFPFLKGLLAKGTCFGRGGLNPKQKASPVLNNLKLC